MWVIPVCLHAGHTGNSSPTNRSWISTRHWVISSYAAEEKIDVQLQPMRMKDVFFLNLTREHLWSAVNIKRSQRSQRSQPTCVLVWEHGSLLQSSLLAQDLVLTDSREYEPTVHYLPTGKLNKWKSLPWFENHCFPHVTTQRRLERQWVN